jgi:hypothetical protein
LRRRDLFLVEGLLFEHDFGGFDDGADGVAQFELHFVGAAPGYDAFDDVGAYANDDGTTMLPSSISSILPRSRLRAERAMAGAYAHHAAKSIGIRIESCRNDVLDRLIKRIQPAGPKAAATTL